MIQSLSFEQHVDSARNWLEISIFGILDEKSKPVIDNILKEILNKKDKYNSILIQLDRIENINSYGIRVWIAFLKEVQTQTSVQFGKVGEIFVDRASVFPQILGSKGTKIQSIALPYFCKHCNLRSIHYFPIQQLTDTNGVFCAPETQCANCNSAMEFDDLDRPYLHFIKNFPQDS